MDCYNKIYCKTENFLKVTIKNREYSFKDEFQK
jgi:hypothetical protein